MPKHGDYIAFIKAEIASTPVGDPIFTKDIAKDMAAQYSLDFTQIKPTVSATVKRLMDTKAIPEFRRWRRGIYYRSGSTEQGEEINIDTWKVFEHLYLPENQYYETAETFVNKIGLSTRVPSFHTYASNTVESIKTHPRGFQGYKVVPPRATITEDNRLYLQILDLLDSYDTYSIGAYDPLGILAKHVQQCNLDTDLLLKTAEDLYSDKAVHHLCYVFSRMIADRASNQTY